MTTESKWTAVSAGAAVAAAGAAVAALQLLQQAVAAFEPKPVISVLVIVAAFLAGLAAARARSRKAATDRATARSGQLHALVGPWSTIAKSDPVRLGVFPHGRKHGRQFGYVGRTVDPELRAAMKPGAFLLVVGEPRAGASRTAFEAACAALPAAHVVAPRDARALKQLLALDPPPDFDTDAAVVWLDGLDRYARVLDATALDALVALTKEVVLVATIREDDWEAWIAGGGPRSPAARAVVNRARVFVLPQRLDDHEKARAGALHPGLDLSRGIGVAAASHGRDRAAPANAPQEDERPTERVRQRSPRRDPGLVVPVAGMLGCLIALAVIWGSSGFDVPTIPEQLAAVRSEGGAKDRSVTHFAVSDLHGTGVRTRLVLFRDGPDPSSPRSDELHIYDEEGDDLVQRWRFEPRVDGSPAQFQYRGTSDIDGDGADEIVGGFGYTGRDQGRRALVPFAIDWDRANERYRPVPLDFGPPTLAREPRGVPAQQYLDLYSEPATFHDPDKGVTLKGHRVQDFILTPNPRRLVAGWFVQPWLGGKPATFELHAAILDTNTATPHLTPCTFPEGPFFTRAGQDRSLVKVFEEAYAEGVENGNCDPWGET